MSEASRKQLSLLDVVNITVGSMVGSGIFIVATDMAQKLSTPWLVLVAWGITALFAVFGALTYGELGAMFPKAGGLYIYLREAFGHKVAFLYGWSFFLAIQCGSLAAVAMAFSKYSGIFFPAISHEVVWVRLGSFPLITSENLMAIACLVLLTLINLREVKTGALVQNIFTLSKGGGLVLIIGIGLIAGLMGLGDWSNLTAVSVHPEAAIGGLQGHAIVLFGGALVGSIFASTAWEYGTFTAGEMRNPARNLPRALLFGTLLVSAIYLLANLVYFYVVPIAEIQADPNERIGALVMQKLLGGAGAFAIAALVMVSTFGCLNGLIFSGARVMYAMSLDGLFFKPAQRLNANGSPAWVLWVQLGWAGLLCLTGRYNELLDFTVFVNVIFYLVPALGVLLLRRTRPTAERPYRVWGYPVVPILFIGICVFVALMALLSNPVYSGFGLVLVVLGLPVYYVFRRQQARTGTGQ
ncbi:MAG: amino acid permease [Bacteroidia bacterium]|nr:amino acid permease [Bacteroidia bacterium]